MRKELTATLILLLSRGALAEGDLRAYVPVLDRTEQRLEFLDADAGPSCTTRGQLCFRAGEGTRAVEPRVAGLTNVPVTATFERMTQRGSHAEPLLAQDSTPWTIELSAFLRGSASGGYVAVALFAAGDAPSRELVALHQAVVPSGTRVAAKLTLSPDLGFTPGTTYRVRVTQVVRGGSELVLGERDVLLK